VLGSHLTKLDLRTAFKKYLFVSVAYHKYMVENHVSARLWDNEQF